MTVATRSQVLTGHLQVRSLKKGRAFYASWWDAKGAHHTTKLGPAHVTDSGRRTARGAVIWRAGAGVCPHGHLTPKTAEALLQEILDDARATDAIKPAPTSAPAVVDDIPTFGDAGDAYLESLEVEKRRKKSTIQDARNVATGVLMARFGRDTPLYTLDRHEVIVRRSGRPIPELREERHDTFTTDDVDAYRRELLASNLSVRTAQKNLVLLHGIFKLAKRRKLIAINPSEDAERVTLEHPGTFNILEPIAFESVYRAVVGELDERPEGARV